MEIIRGEPPELDQEALESAMRHRSVRMAMTELVRHMIANFHFMEHSMLKTTWRLKIQDIESAARLSDFYEDE